MLRNSNNGLIAPIVTPTPETNDYPSTDYDNELEYTPDPNYYENNDPYEPPGEHGPSARFPFPGTMSIHTTNNPADVMFLQTTLNHVRRSFTSVRFIDSPTGSFGGVTRGAVVDFQLRMNIPPSGIVDENTWYSLVYVFENPPDAPDPPFSPVVQQWYFTLVGLHLRAAPSQESESFGVAPVGTAVFVVDYIANDSWFFVHTEDGYTGYMKAEFLIVDFDQQVQLPHIGSDTNDEVYSNDEVYEYEEDYTYDEGHYYYY